MIHYSLEQWADYVRGTSPKAEKAAMKRHLDSGCKECAQAAGMWTTVLRLARKESGYQPPESAVTLAKSSFVSYRIKGNELEIPMVARLVFDSFRQTPPTGVRSGGPSSRHRVYRAGSMQVDIWTEPADQATAVDVTGQVLDQVAAVQPVNDMVVKACSADGDIVTTTTNQFGEFHLVIGQTTEKDLQLTLGHQEKIEVLIRLRSSEVVQDAQ